MKTTMLKVVYTIPEGIDRELDDKIRKAMYSIGGKWYASGCNLETGERDNCFDVPVEAA